MSLCYSPVVEKHVSRKVSEVQSWFIFHVVVHAGQLQHMTLCIRRLHHCWGLLCDYFRALIWSNNIGLHCAAQGCVSWPLLALHWTNWPLTSLIACSSLLSLALLHLLPLLLKASHRVPFLDLYSSLLSYFLSDRSWHFYENLTLRQLESCLSEINSHLKWW